MTSSSTTNGLPVERLRLSARSYNALVRAGLDTVEQLRKVKNFESIRGINRKGAEEIRRALQAFASSRSRV